MGFRSPRTCKRRLRPTSCAEPLEPRTLLSALVVNDTPGNDTIALVVNDTPGNDTIALGVTQAGGVSVILNGNQTDYAPGQWDSVVVESQSGTDTIDVSATVVPTTVHYRQSAIVNVGDVNGCQDIAAPLDMNGAVGGPVLPGTATVSIDDSGDAGARQVVLVTEGEQQRITGLAPAEIDIGVVVPPVSPATPAGPVGADSFSLTTGSGNDSVVVHGLNIPGSILKSGGSDTVNVGAGSLAHIASDLSVGPTYTFPDGTRTALTVDDSNDAAPAQFTISDLLPPSPPPGPGAYGTIVEQGANVPQTTIRFRTAGVPSATIDGGTAGNTFHVVQTPPASFSNVETITLNTGIGNDSVTVDATNPQTVLNVNGQQGDDTLTTGPIGPFMGILGPLNFDGGEGADSLVVQGPVANPLGIAQTPVLVTAGMIAHEGATIDYANISRLQLENGRFEINNDLGPISLSVTSAPSDLTFQSPTRVTVRSTQNLNTLDLLDGPLVLESGGGIVLNCTSLDITGGSLDLANNAIQVHYANADPFAAVRGYILKHSIFSSAADAHHNVGYADSADGIVPNLASHTILAKLAFYGDANLDGTVDFADLLLLAQNYSRRDANWDQGDFNYDRTVNFADLLLLAQNYGAGTAAPAAAVYSRGRLR